MDSQNGAYPGIRIHKQSGHEDNMSSDGIQLSFGTFNTHGRVEVRKNGIWGTVCNDNTNENSYVGGQSVDDRVATVVCKQLG
jgi:hypothetical protein